MAFTTGAKALSAEQWRDKGKMTLLATSAHRCALSNVVVAHVDSTGDPAADRKVDCTGVNPQWVCKLY